MRYEIVAHHWTKNHEIERTVNAKNKRVAKANFERTHPDYAIVQITARESPFIHSGRGNAKRVSKMWLEKYFGIRINSNQYTSFWQTDGGKATQEFDRLNSREYEIIHRSGSKTYWGKLK